MSESEQFLKGTSQIKILSAEDIEGMRVVCKVTSEAFPLVSVLLFLVSKSPVFNGKYFVHVTCSLREKS